MSRTYQQDEDTRAIKIDPGPWPDEEEEGEEMKENYVVRPPEGRELMKKEGSLACFVGVDDKVCGKDVTFMAWTGDGPLWEEKTWSCPGHLGWVVQSMMHDGQVAHVAGF